MGTAYSDAVAAVKEDINGRPFLMLKRGSATDPNFPSGLFGFRLPDGISNEKAQEIATYMRDNLGRFLHAV